MTEIKSPRDFRLVALFVAVLEGWWCSLANGSASWSRRLQKCDANIDRDDLYPRWGFSVRCIKDAE